MIYEYWDAQPAGPSQRPTLDLAQRWDEFTTLYFSESARRAQDWLLSTGEYTISQIRALAEENNEELSEDANLVISRVQRMLDHRDTML